MGRWMLGFLVLPFMFSGCASAPLLAPFIPTASEPAQMLTSTRVDLSQRNYRIVKADVVGVSKGFKLLGLITIRPSSPVKALSQLYEVGEVEQGKAQTVANVMYQRTSGYYVLFSIPRVTVRADIIEFVAP